MKPFPGFLSKLLIIFIVSITMLVIPRALTGQKTPHQENAAENKPGEELKPVPYPPLDHLEKAVSDQLQEGRRMVDVVSADLTASRQKRAEAYGELGQLYHAYELNEAAEACYRNALVLDPSHLEWTYSLGYLLQLTGRFSEALQFYQQMKIDPQNPQLAYLVHIRIGECFRKLNQLDQAKSAFEAAYQLNPEGPAVLARLGEIALEERRFDDAIKYISSALEKQPEANRLHYSLGMAYRGKGDTEKARLHLSQYGMVGVQPPDPVKTHLEKLVTGYWTHILAGKLAFSAGRYTEAARAFEKAIKENPEDAGARINLSAALGQLKKYQEAITQLQEAIRLEPENVTAHFNLGSLQVTSGDYKEAIKHFQFVVKKNPKDSQAHLALANGFQKEQQFDKAIEHYKVALTLDPGLSWAWIDLASVLRSVGRQAEALKVLEEAHSRIPYDGPIAHALARLLVTTPDLDQRQGQRALELALKVYQAFEDIEHARTVAFAYAELNQCDNAAAWLEKAIELASKSSGSAAIVENLKSNLEYFKTNRPCRVPAKQEREAEKSP
jgi:tetratricopeptide (TPR) repeat protein